MQVSTANDVKVYNISNGKSLPEWISERKRRKLLQNDEDLRRSIELIQDFEMPTAATCVTMTNDQQYILAAGTYKPRVRCYDTSQLSLKFERCLNSEVVAMKTLSDDYSKFVMLLSDRNLEFHIQHGTYYHTRVPVFGRDLAYHYPSCDLYVASASSEVYRLNLEQGRFMSPMATKSSGSNVCVICDDHQLLALGTEEGVVECYDPRSNTCVGILDACSGESGGVSALKFRDGLTLGVGTGSGHVLLYDMRSPHPLQRKDHHYQLPIVSLHFNREQDFVLSSDKKALRIWNRQTGSTFTSVEVGHDINGVCPVDNSGLILFAVEDSKMQSYFIPSLGPAPKWCSFLDNLTEELEEVPQNDIYDDYKFVTNDDIVNLGLSHLIGTNTLRAHMHGYFMDMRLYHKARSIAEPFAYDEYRRQKVKERIQQKSANRAVAKALPKVNRQLAKKLRQQGHQKTATPLTDDRFADLFNNPVFQIDEESEEFRSRNPALIKHLQQKQPSADDDDHHSNESDDSEGEESDEVGVAMGGASITIHEGDRRTSSSISQKRVSLGKLMSQLPEEEVGVVRERALGSQEMSFKLKKGRSSRTTAAANSVNVTGRNDRKHLRRSASSILPKKKGSVYWKGRRVK